MLQRPARHLHLQTLADSMEAEAATWKLVEQLYAIRDKFVPGGSGGATLSNCGSERTVRQRQADLIYGDAKYNKYEFKT